MCCPLCRMRPSGRWRAFCWPYRDGQTPKWTEISYDAQGRVLQVRAPDNSRTHYYYNYQKRPFEASGAPGQTLLVEDAWGTYRWGRTNALGQVEEMVEPKPDDRRSVFGTGNKVTYYYYDYALGTLVSIRREFQPRAQVYGFNYDSLGRLTHLFTPEKDRTLDDAGAYRGPNLGTWSDVFTYDERSNLTSHTDARGVKTNYYYGPFDNIGDLWTDKDPLNRLHRVEYVHRVDTQNPISPAPDVTYEYMSTGDKRRLRRVATADSTEEYGYDAEGRLDSKTQTILSLSAYPLSINYFYDGLNRLTDVTYPQQYGSPRTTRKVLHYDYRLADRLGGLQVDGADHASQITYNAASQVELLKVGPAGPNQVTEIYGYDPAIGLLDRQEVQRAGASLLDLSYGYVRLDILSGRTGRLTLITDNLDPDKGRSYEYDALGRLARAMGGRWLAPLWTQEYSYDPSGNRTSVWATGQTADGSPIPRDGLAQVSYDESTNRITTPGFAYDAAGNQTRVQRVDGSWQRYQYDAAGRLVKVSDDAGNVLEVYAYGASRQRLMTRSRQTLNAPTYYVWSGDSVLAEYIEETEQRSGEEIAVLRWRKDYVYVVGRLLSTSTPGAGGEVVKYHHPDRLGTRLVTTEADPAVIEQVTLPFGVALDAESTGAPLNPRFTSYDRSAATGLDYAVNRFYDPQQGRFTQVDPLEMAAIVAGDPQSYNLYSYVRNDPINFTDPSGLDGEPLPTMLAPEEVVVVGDLSSLYSGPLSPMASWFWDWWLRLEGGSTVIDPETGRRVLGEEVVVRGESEESKVWEQVASWSGGGEYVDSLATLFLMAWSLPFALGAGVTVDLVTAPFKLALPNEFQIRDPYNGLLLPRYGNITLTVAQGYVMAARAVGKPWSDLLERQDWIPKAPLDMPQRNPGYPEP
jgi:RHS repeat-associated protein